MELVNIGFVILCIKLGLSVVPVALGIYLLAMSDENRREMRGYVCRRFFGVTNAIPYRNFVRGVVALSVSMIVIGILAGWFLVLRPFFA